MKRASAAVAVAAAAWAVAQAPAPNATLAGYIPAGAVLLLEARDFASLWKEWNSSAERAAWVDSANYQVFSRSRLFYRLKEAQEEFAAAAGLAPDLALVEAVAGAESAVAIYDIGRLEFLYITRLAQARAMESALWGSRGKYQSRQSAGKNYFVRVDPNSKRVAAFAASDGLLLLATREDALAGALALISGQKLVTVQGEAWFQQAVRGAGAAGELRLVLNLEGLVRSPHFRSYWIQRNVSELRPFTAAVSDLRRGVGEVREDRVLVRAQAGQARDGAATARLLRLAPEGTGLYRAWSAPEPGMALAALERKVLAPRPAAQVESKQAPEVSLDPAVAGSADDLDTRIDQAPPAPPSSDFTGQALLPLLEQAKLTGQIVLESSRPAPQSAFVGLEAAVVLEASADWDAAAMRAGLLASIQNLYSTSGLGMGWRERRCGAHPCHELDGLARLAVGVSGRVLVVATAPEMVGPVLDRVGRTAPPSGPVYAAGYRHSRELDPFARMMRLMDYPSLGGAPEGGEGREPHFFSENLASLGRVLGRVESARLEVSDAGSSVSARMVYRLTK